MAELYAKFLNIITQWQYTLNKTISTTIKGMDNENTLTASLIVIAIAFAYGLIHAAGPGHGKALAALYFVRSNRSYKDAFRLGFLISIIHAVSALVVTFVLYFVVKKMFRQNFNDFSDTAMLISGIMILLIGLYIIYHSIKEKNASHDENLNENKSKYAAALSIGIVPCPGVMSIVLFCIILQKFALGIFAAIAMSIGMGLTISIVGILSVLFSKKTDGFLHSYGYILQVISGVLIVLLGVFLILPHL